MSPIESAAWRVVLRHSDSRRSSHRFRLRRYRGCQNRNPLVAWSPHVSYLVGGRRSLCRTHLSRIPCYPLPPDLPLLFGNSPKVGLGLYNSISAVEATALECGMFILGAALYATHVIAKRKTGRSR